LNCRRMKVLFSSYHDINLTQLPCN
jgi:hypothetical protein